MLTFISNSLRRINTFGRSYLRFSIICLLLIYICTVSALGPSSQVSGQSGVTNLGSLDILRCCRENPVCDDVWDRDAWTTEQGANMFTDLLSQSVSILVLPSVLRSSPGGSVHLTDPVLIRPGQGDGEGGGWTSDYCALPLCPTSVLYLWAALTATGLWQKEGMSFLREEQLWVSEQFS